MVVIPVGSGILKTNSRDRVSKSPQIFRSANFNSPSDVFIKSKNLHRTNVHHDVSFLACGETELEKWIANFERNLSKDVYKLRIEAEKMGLPYVDGEFWMMLEERILVAKGKTLGIELKALPKGATIEESIANVGVLKEKLGFPKEVIEEKPYDDGEDMFKAIDDFRRQSDWGYNF